MKLGLDVAITQGFTSQRIGRKERPVPIGHFTNVWDTTWSTDWTHLIPFAIGGEAYLFAYKEGTGRASVDHVAASGSLTNIYDQTWTTGWTAFAVLNLAGHPHLLSYKGADGRASLDRTGLQAVPQFRQPAWADKLDEAELVTGAKQASLILKAIQEFANSSAASPWNLERDKVAERLRSLIQRPALVKQGKLGLCGPAAFFRLFLRRGPVQFARYAMLLFEQGASHIRSLRVEPSSDLVSADYASIMGELKAEDRCPETDWMTMSALRDVSNSTWDYEGTPDEDFALITTPMEMRDWLEASGFYSSVVDEGNWAFRAGLAHALDLAPNGDTDIALLLNSHVLNEAAGPDGKKKAKGPSGAFPNHFVILLNPVLESNGNVTFGVWTWGEIHPALTVSTERFDHNYYGAVIARV
jgi:hypothetical protein